MKNFYIAGYGIPPNGYKISDWKKLLKKINNDFENKVLWQQACEILDLRLKTRYLQPINKLMPSKNGGGFAVVTIQCSIIEFLYSIYNGVGENNTNKYIDLSNKKSHFFRVNKYSNGKEIQSNTKKLFISFLTSYSPFNYFKNFGVKISLASNFYDNVRCGLLHQAETKSNWIIMKGKKRMIKKNRRTEEITFYRDAFQIGIMNWLSTYKKQLLAGSNNVRENFIFKMNSICQLIN